MSPTFPSTRRSIIRQSGRLAVAVACLAASGAAWPAGSIATPCGGSITPADLCDAVAGQVLETDSSKGTRYTYQTKILAAACVDAGVDPAGTVQRKVQQFWQDSGPKLVCSRLDFSLQNGHVLKLAVERNSRDFINDVVRKWKLNLNIIDGADQRTVLDYISAQLDLARARGSALEPILRRYFDLFRTHGAKHAKEL